MDAPDETECIVTSVNLESLVVVVDARLVESPGNIVLVMASDEFLGLGEGELPVAFGDIVFLKVVVDTVRSSLDDDVLSNMFVVL